MAKKANAKKRKKVIELRKPKKSTKADAKNLTIEERLLRLEIDRGIVEDTK